MAVAQSERAKKIKIYKNGDAFFTGKDIVLNKRTVPTWDSFLQTLTSDLKTTDAVRRLVTPTHGHQITDLEDIQDSRQYVAVGNGRFKNVGYLNLSSHLISPRGKGSQQSPVRPVEHNRRLGPVVSGRIKKIPTDVLTIFVYANGRDQESARRLTLSYKIRDNWDAILREVDEKVPPSIGATRKLYTLEGAVVKGPDALEPYGYYVAVGSEMGGFRKLDYGAIARPVFNTSPQRGRHHSFPLDNSYTRRNWRRTNRSQQDSSSTTMTNSTTPGPRRLKPIQYTQKKPGAGKSTVSEPVRSVNDSLSSTSEDRGAKSDGQYSPGRKQGLPTEQRKRPPKKQQDDVFHAKPVKHRRSKDSGKEVDYDKDEGGVFRAKASPGAERAEEVEETKDTKVDLPIDQMEAEEVKDEDISDEPLKTSRSSPKEKSPSPTPKEKSPTPPPPKEKTPTPPPPKEKTPTPPSSPKPQSPAAADRIPTPQNEAEEEQDASQQKQKEDEAAAKIQAGFRGMQTRRDMKKAKEQKDNTKDQEQKEKEAATKIQAGFNGYKTRQNVKEMKAKKEEEKVKHEAATKIQAGFRGYETRKKINDSKSKNKSEEETRAALKIQAGFRGYQTRKSFKEQREKQEISSPENDHEKKEAASKIQAGFRGYQTRKMVKEKKETEEKEKAAQKIQAGFKGYQTRKTLNEKKANDTEEKRKAASKIQAGFRGYQTRKSFKEIREKQEISSVNDHEKKEAASKIQGGFRGYQTRKSLKQQKEKEAENRRKEKAATKIQAGFKGYQTRKSVNELKKSPISKSEPADDHTEEEKKAAEKIQASFKGYQTRKKFADTKDQSKKDNNRNV